MISTYRSSYLAFLQMKACVEIEIDVVNNDASGQFNLVDKRFVARPRPRLRGVTKRRRKLSGVCSKIGR